MKVEYQFEVSDGVVNVRCAIGEKCAQQGRLPAHIVARLLTSEIIRDPSSCDVRYTPSRSQQFLREIDAD